MTATTPDLTDAPAPEKRTLLESWSKLLDSIDVEKNARVTPQIANRVLTAWPKLDFSDLPRYYERYYELSQEMRNVVEHEISTHPESLGNIEKDGEDNAERYLNIMFGWQQVIILAEHEWDTEHPEAALELAAIADVQNFYLGDRGLLAHLGMPELGFSFDDEESEAFKNALKEWKESL